MRLSPDKPNHLAAASLFVPFAIFCNHLLSTLFRPIPGWTWHNNVNAQNRKRLFRKAFRKPVPVSDTFRYAPHHDTRIMHRNRTMILLASAIALASTLSTYSAKTDDPRHWSFQPVQRPPVPTG